MFAARVQADIVRSKVIDHQLVSSTHCVVLAVAPVGRVDHVIAGVKDDVVCEDRPRTGVVSWSLEVPVDRVDRCCGTGQVRGLAECYCGVVEPRTNCRPV